MCNVPKPIRRISSQAISLNDATNTHLKTKGGSKKRHSSSSASSHHHHNYPHLQVQHNYHDRSHEAKPADMDLAHEITVRCTATSPFPLKLFHMLAQVEQDGYGHVVSWQPHGRCFVIHNNQEFTKLLPRYFKLSKIASFQRQLNLYGFQRITQGLDKGSYYHEYFLRSKEYLAYKILRIKVKGTGVRGKSNPEQEPNFWNMPWVGCSKEQTEQSEKKHAASQEQVANITATISSAIMTSPAALEDLQSQQTQASAAVVSPQTPAKETTVLEVPSSIKIPRRYSDHIVAASRPTDLPRRAVSAPISADKSSTRLLWGMPFQALDNLPEDPDLQKAQTVRRPSTSFTLADLDDQTYMDECLNAMFQEYNDNNKMTTATASNSMEDSDMAEMLDLIVSAN